ncbi:hypothetical protein PIROE2DRAFT_13407, partial [Piromyces sp. E2]
SLNLNIESSIFEDNESSNGAEYFGGGIYSDFVGLKSSKLNNVEFTKNYAYAGGALYTTNNNEETMFNVYDKENVIFNNNTSESHGNNYATGPYMINLMSEVNQVSITSGELYPLKFNIVDEYNQLIYDYYKYYSSIYISVENYDYNNEEDSYYNNNDDIHENKMTGNICIFSKDFNLKFSLDNKMNINFNVDNVNVTIKDCKDDYIKMYDKNNFYHCESPLCNDECPLKEKRAICIKKGSEFTNNKYSNECKCLDGWNGNNCNEKEFAKYDKTILYSNGYIAYINHFYYK